VPPAPQRIDIGALEVQPGPQPRCPEGDYNRDGVVNSADYTIWRDTLGGMVAMPYDGADGNGDRQIDQDDYGVCVANFGETCPMASHTFQEEFGSHSSGIQEPTLAANAREIAFEYAARSIDTILRPKASERDQPLSRSDLNAKLLALLSIVEHPMNDRADTLSPYLSAGKGQTIDENDRRVHSNLKTIASTIDAFFES
jgi:hypothetical protein